MSERLCYIVGECTGGNEKSTKSERTEQRPPGRRVADSRRKLTRYGDGDDLVLGIALDSEGEPRVLIDDALLSYGESTDDTVRRGRRGQLGALASFCHSHGSARERKRVKEIRWKGLLVAHDPNRRHALAHRGSNRFSASDRRGVSHLSPAI